MVEKEFLQQLKQVESTIDNVCYLYNKNYSRRDLMQDIFLELWKSRNSFKKNSTFKSWAYIIARNICVSTLRKQQQQPVIEGLDDYKEILEELDNTPELLKQLHNAKRYTSVLNTIEEPYRTLFHKYVYGASFRDLARYSGIAENTLRVRIHRIKKQLQLRYGNYVIN